MSFVIVTDTSSNLPTPYLKEHGVEVIPFTYHINGQEYACMDTESFDGPAYYGILRRGTRITTSQIPPQRYRDTFLPLLLAGKDILFVGMSSGISGSYASSEIAAAELREQFPERTIRTVDTLAAALGEGILVMHAVDWRDAGLSIDEIADLLLERRHRVAQIVLLDDLMYLSRGGRLSGAKALIGTVLGIRPILKGNSAGQLVVCGKVRSRRTGIATLAEKFAKLAENPGQQRVGIVYTDCKADAEALAEMLRQLPEPPKEIMTVCYEPVTGSYVGLGTVALFFEGIENVREY